MLTASALAMTAVFALAGCAAGNAEPQPEPQNAGSNEQAPPQASTDSQTGENDHRGDAAAEGSATITLAGQSFTFTPSTCIIDAADAVVSGPGADDDSGDPARLDIDVYGLDSEAGGEVRITLGTDQPFVTTDDFLVAFVGDPHDYVIGAGSGWLQIDGTFRANGETPLGPGTVVVDCN